MCPTPMPIQDDGTHPPPWPCLRCWQFDRDVGGQRDDASPNRIAAGMNLRQLLQRSDRPFLSQPQVGRYFPGAAIEDARRRLARSIERGDGPGVVIGAAGTGKSLLLQVLAAQYHERFDV